MDQNIIIRRGEKRDLPAILALIKELANYEHAPNEVTVSLEELEHDGFGEEKLFDFFVSEMNGQVVGMALYYTKYSTWKGRCLFLEDLIVAEEHRGKKLGVMLFEAVALVAKIMKARRMEWQVLDWNEPAIRFYKRYNAVLDSEWINGKLTYDQLQNLTVNEGI